MAVSDRMSGADLVVEWHSGGGTATLSGSGRNLEVTAEQETADATAAADGARVRIATLKNYQASMELLYEGTAGSADHTLAALGAEGTLIYGPQGTAAGKPKGGFTAIVSSKNETYPFDNVVTLNLEFMGQGTALWDPTVDVF